MMNLFNIVIIETKYLTNAIIYKKRVNGFSFKKANLLILKTKHDMFVYIKIT